ncbi:MAG: acetyltransferase [Flavobacteriaceae bacterium]
MKDIILFGGGGHGYATIALIKSLGEFMPKVIYDDNPKKKSILEVPLKSLEGEEVSSKYMCISIGNNKVRKEKAAFFGNALFPNFIHQKSVVYPSVILGKGTLVLPNAVLDAAVTLGDFCIINNNATVSHNCTLGDFVHVAINVAISGGVTVGEGTLVGAGSVVLPEITVGKWATIGAGAVVTKNVPDYGVVYGNPARIVKYNTPHED